MRLLPRILLISAFYLAVVGVCVAQKSPGDSTPPATSNMQAIKSSSAYAEILLRKTELESDLESLLISYTEEVPKVRDTRYELGLIQKDLQSLLAQSDAAKLTLALGKLMVRRAQVATDFWSLQARFGNEYPDVKRAKRKLLSFDSAIKEILP